MAGDQEVGKCMVCKEDNKVLQRTVFHYDIKCECHSPNHFESISHCAGCVPIEPKETKITVKTSSLSRPNEAPNSEIVFLIASACLQHSDSKEASHNIEARRILLALHENGYKLIKQ